MRTPTRRRTRRARAVLVRPMRALDRKLLRDLWHLRGQVLAIALVIVVRRGRLRWLMSLATYDSLLPPRPTTTRDYRFADVFAAPASARRRRWPRRIARAARRGSELRDARGRRREPRGRGASRADHRDCWYPCPTAGRRMLNRLCTCARALPEAVAADEVVAGEAFADAHRLRPGDRLAAIINGKRQHLTVVGIAAVAGVRLPDRAGRDVSRLQALRRALDGARRAGRGLRHGGRLQRSSRSPSRAGAERGTTSSTASTRSWRPTAAAAPTRARPDSRTASCPRRSSSCRRRRRCFPAIFLGVAAFLLNVVVDTPGRARSASRSGSSRPSATRNAAIGATTSSWCCCVALLGVAAGVALGVWFGRGLSNIYMETLPLPVSRFRTAAEGRADRHRCHRRRGARRHAVRRASRGAPAAGRGDAAGTAGGLPRHHSWNGSACNAGSASPVAMILRHIERRPVKSLLTVLGIACACALMIVGNYQKGAIDFMVDVQFRLAAREDLAVTFTEPTSAAALHELAALPGVRRVEGFRDVPAILRFAEPPLSRGRLRHPARGRAAPLARPRARAGRSAGRRRRAHRPPRREHPAPEAGRPASPSRCWRAAAASSRCRCWASPASTSACRRTCARTRSTRCCARATSSPARTSQRVRRRGRRLRPAPRAAAGARHASPTPRRSAASTQPSAIRAVLQPGRDAAGRIDRPSASSTTARASPCRSGDANWRACACWASPAARSPTSCSASWHC